MKIKTLHITNAYHRTSGGIGTFYRALMDAANRHGRSMRLVVPGEETTVEEVGEFGRIYTVAARRSPLFDRRYRVMLPHKYLPPFRGPLTRILEEEKPDLVEICDKYSINWLAGFLRRGWALPGRRPTLVGMNCERMDDNVGAYLTRSKVGKWWSKFYLGRVYIPLFDYHIANSQYTADELRGAMVKRHERQIHVCPMGANFREFANARPSEEARARLLARFNGGDRTKLLLYAGRLSPEKNVGLLLDMMKRLTDDKTFDYRLIAVGAGPLAEWLEKESNRRLPERVFVSTHITDRAALVDLYVNCDAFVHPNPREPFGIAPLEAMAANLSLIAPRAGGVLSYADETNAWLAEPNGQGFAHAARSIFSDPAARKDKLTRARWTAQRYCWEDVTARFFRLYDEFYEGFPTLRFARGAGRRAASGSAYDGATREKV
jgi:glycosyltransferase involved in cell wall biosynthesis